MEVRDNLDAESLPGGLKLTDILVVRSTKVTAAAIKAAPLLSLIIRAGAGVDNIDLAAASAGHLRRQLPRQEHGRGGRIGHRTFGGCRPPHCRRDDEHARRRMEEEGIRQGPRPGRADPGHPRLRSDRPGDGPACNGLGHESHRLVPQPHKRNCRSGRHRIRGLARRTGSPMRRSEHPSGLHARDEAFRRREVPRCNAPRRDPRQHLAGALVDTAALCAAIAAKGLRVGSTSSRASRAAATANGPTRSLPRS